MSRRSRAWLIVLTGLLVLFAALGWVVEAWTEWLWYDELGATQVFTGQLTTRLVLFAVAAIVVGGFVFGNLYLAYRLRPFLPPTGQAQEALERYRYLLGPRLARWFSIAAGVIGLFAGLAAQGHWQDWMMFTNAQEFGQTDPEFGLDIGFYVFRLPFWEYLLSTGFTVTVLALLGSLAVHYLYGGMRISGSGDRLTTGARAHLTGLVAFFVILKAIAYWFDQRALLLDTITGTKLTGAGYADINALLPAKEMLMYISIIVAIAILVFSNAVMRNLTGPGVALGLLLVSAIAIGGIYPWGVQTFQVDPSRNVKEAEYIGKAINSTRVAFGLESTKRVEYTSNTTTPPPELAQDKTVVPNLRLLDPAVVPEAYNQLAQLRPYYRFGEKLDIDRYTMKDGSIRDYVVGLREISYDAKVIDNWISRHTIYTHGYGMVAAPANAVCPGTGLPKFVSGFFNEGSNLGGCAAATGELPEQTQPRVYYGEKMREYAIVGKPTGGADAEYDRPVDDKSDNNFHYTYDGKGGVSLDSTWRRLLYSIKFAESNFLLADAVNDNSKILYERDPRTRVQKLAPFLTLDGDPYPAVVGGRIVWIVDGYTTSANYPYSKRTDLREATNDSLTGDGTFQLARQQINYIRNSVKATVDAYDGTVSLYQFDEKDPVLKAWNLAFGGKLIKPKSEIPKELAEHFRYPADLFKVQRDLLTQFHVENPGDYFTGADFWAVPDDPSKQGEAKQPPYYLLTKLPEQDAVAFQLVAALTPRDKGNLAALVSGSYVDGQPRLQLLELGKDSPIPGPFQALQQMENNDSIRKELALYGQNKVYGNLLSLPFGGGMLYVEPIYLKTQGETTYPQLKKIMLSYGDKVAFADTVGEGIAQLTGTAPPPPTVPDASKDNPPPAKTTVAAAAEKVNKAIEDLKAAQKAGDFEAQGKALKALDEAIKEYLAAQAAAASPSPTPKPTG